MTIKRIIKRIWRYPLCKYYRDKLKTDQFTIISSDCVGGCLYHDFGLQFTSPTINLTIPKSIDFFENLDHYLQTTPIPNGYSPNGEPIILLDDLPILGVHYHNHDDLIEKWNTRKKRIVWDNIIIMTNTRFLHTEADRERFCKLPYTKVLFTSETPKYSFEVYSPALKKGKDLSAYCDWLGRRFFEKYLDCVQFLNESVE